MYKKLYNRSLINNIYINRYYNTISLFHRYNVVYSYQVSYTNRYITTHRCIHTQQYIYQQQQQQHNNNYRQQQQTDNTHARHTTAKSSYLPANRLLRYTIYITALGIIIYVTPPLNYALSTTTRFFRTLYTLGCIAVDYKHFFLTHKDDKQDNYQQLLSQVHQHSANRIYDLCMANTGLYIKVGQYMASMNHVLPIEYIQTLRVLQDQAPSVDFNTIEHIICTELKINKLSDIFKYFNRKPLAAASLAQVHYAITHDNDEVAVKVQYPKLRSDFVVDMLAHYIVITVGGYLFYNFDLQWLHYELEENLRKELDFTQEAKNNERCKLQLLHGYVKHVTTPHIVWKYTTSSVLTQEYIHGIKINDIKQHQYNGIDTNKAITYSIQSLAEQIFLHGFVHCDPHPGNIFVRPLDNNFKHPIAIKAHQILQNNNNNNNNEILLGTEITDDKSIKADTTQTKPIYDTTTIQRTFKNTKFEIVLLDHGLYRDVSEHVRLTYCKLWQSLILHDDQRVQRYCRELGIKSHYEWFATAVLMRPYKLPITAKVGRVSKAELERIRQKAQSQIPAILQMSKEMPRELLLVMRNQNYLRSLNAELGAPVNRFRIMARAAVRGIYYKQNNEITSKYYNNNDTTQMLPYTAHVDTYHKQSYRLYGLQGLFNRLKFEFYLFVYDVINSITVLYIKIFHRELIEQSKLPADDPNSIPVTG